MKPDSMGTRMQVSQTDSPLKQLLLFLNLNTDTYLPLIVVLAAAFLARALIALGPFSGQGCPPLHGDFEAQRHWLEITQHLPMKQWYFYDLQYWGLDYPPLTAFHSWVLGRIGSWVNPEWFMLDQSRGIEEYGAVVFMRYTVIVSDFFTYVPAIMLFARRFTISVVDTTSNVLLLLLQPSLLLIDHGHFQYNSVMLGCLVLCLHFLLQDRLHMGALFFVLCLSFKQMGLYYAPAIFSFLLSKTIGDFSRFARLAIVTVLAFGLLFGPFFLVDGMAGLQQVLLRMFPFSRGLFEDKVANFWCATNVIYKLKRHFSNEMLQRLSLLATLASIIPGVTILFLRPTARNLVLGTANCAWGFFLFSFQVHEKSVLLPLIPSTLLLFGPRSFRSWVGYINIVAAFSLWPLLKKDQLQLQYFVFTGIWIWLGGLWRLPIAKGLLSRGIRSLHLLTYAGIFVLHLAEPVVRIENKPDLWTVLNVLFCAPAFGVFYVWTLYHIVQTSHID